MRHISAQASSGTANSVSLTKSTQVASDFLQRSSTVPVRELNLAPQRGQRQRRTPVSVEPSLHGEGFLHEGHAG